MTTAGASGGGGGGVASGGSASGGGAAGGGAEAAGKAAGGAFVAAAARPALSVQEMKEESLMKYRGDALELAVRLALANKPNRTDDEIVGTARKFYDFIKTKGGGSNV